MFMGMRGVVSSLFWHLSMNNPVCDVIYSKIVELMSVA